MHFEKLTEPNPRFRLFGAPESRFLSAFGQGKGALGIPKGWIRCSPKGRQENISMATQLSCARARKSFIQWCSVPRGLHIKSLHHFLVNVCEENNSLLLRVPAQVAGWEHLFAIIAGHGKPPFAVLAFAVRPAAPAECVDASPAPGAQGSPPGMHRPSSNFCPSIRLSPPWLGPSSNFCKLALSQACASAPQPVS